MKVAISSTGKDLNALIDPRFGRCACFIVVDIEDMKFKHYENEYAALSGGVGIQAASFLASKGVAAVLTGQCGPNAMKIFDASGINVFAGISGTIHDAIERFKLKTLTLTTQPTVSEKAGLSSSVEAEIVSKQPMGRCQGGSGRGLGMGGGRGMGGGGGKGAGRGGGVGSGDRVRPTPSGK